MAKKKIIKDDGQEEEIEVEDIKEPNVTPLAILFGNGDDNILRDKLNEVISFLNK